MQQVVGDIAGTRFTLLCRMLIGGISVPTEVGTRVIVRLRESVTNPLLLFPK